MLPEINRVILILVELQLDLCNFFYFGISCGNLKIYNGTERKRKTKPKPPATKEKISKEVTATLVIN